MNSRLLGSILIIAGSSIGGGMLAMPITSAGVGFLGATLLLFVIWFAMCYTALLMVRIYDFNSSKDGFDTLTKKYAGLLVNRIAGLSLMFLIYGLTAAYMSGGGTILKTNIDLLFDTNIDDRLTVLAFSLVFSAVVIIGTRWVDWFTRILFGAKVVFLVLLVILMTPLIKWANLLHMPLSQGIVIMSIPAIFTSFGFHGSIPSIVDYLDGNKKMLRKAFILGSLLPLVIYLIWQIVILGSLDQTVFMQILNEHSEVKGLLLSIRELSHSTSIETLFSFFAATALGTSFLGVSIGLFDYYRDLFKDRKKSTIRPLATICTFVPPLMFALFYPEGFILALGYAAIAGVILALVIPIILYLKAMKFHNIRISSLQYFIISFILLLSLLIVYAQLLVVSNK
ncbi:aromatic amino acid transporter [Myroides sp. M-43]|uniref:aromatic amino acid transporter n=1 Tax=Myroides oncorhynchi TaxID=2893756 RepID=UPI001E4921A0|nr:aromatic amino acid transporter [Myroides oncorhynchi]MCC9042420.1 aromatic amino acid transporter [Myroides oncorhynchi]